MTMTKLPRKVVALTAAFAATFAGLFWSGDITLSTGSSLVSEAQAIIGRPLTPVSYAGVARRTVRRCAAGVYYC
jgi:hypothetical protein